MNDIDKAAAILKRGGLVAMPTETVYGLAALATDETAVARVFTVKGRPADHPLIVHVASKDEVPIWAKNCPAGASRLIERFWPGPLTVILTKQPQVSALVTADQPTVALRCPDHPVALALLRKVGTGLVAPSANRFGKISPTSAGDVRVELGDKIDLILDGGDCPIGIESTIVDYSQGRPVLLRPGHLGVEAIGAVCGEPVSCSDNASPKAPGSLPAHYAPSTALLCLDAESIAFELAQQRPGVRLAAIVRTPIASLASDDIAVVTMPKNAIDYARIFYRTLRTLDRGGFSRILVERLPDEPIWSAINDRIGRAVVGSNSH